MTGHPRVKNGLCMFLFTLFCSAPIRRKFQALKELDDA